MILLVALLMTSGLLYLLMDDRTEAVFEHTFDSSVHGYFYYGNVALDDDAVYVGTSVKWHALRDEGGIPSNFLLIALDKRDGGPLWSQDLGRGEVISGPMLADGKVLVSVRAFDEDGYRVNVSVMAFAVADGSLVWIREVVSTIPVDPTREGPEEQQWLSTFHQAGLAWDGQHLLAGGDNIHLLDIEDGNVIWAAAPSSPDENVNHMIIQGGFAYASTRSGVDRVLLTDGGVSRFSPIGISTPWQMTGCQDGGIILGTSGSLVRLNSTGDVVWEYSTGGQDVRAQAAIDADGNIYVGTKANQQSYFFKLSADGEEAWRVDVGADMYSSPSLGDDGRVYVGSENWNGRGGTVHILNSSDGNADGRIIVGRDIMWMSPAIDGGLLYVGGMGGSFAAYEVEAVGLLASHWPTRDRNLNRTASIT